MHRDARDPPRLQACLGNEAVILQDPGDLDGAKLSHREVERFRELGDSAGLAIGLRNLTDCLVFLFAPWEAFPLVGESVDIARRLVSPALRGRLQLLEQIRAALPPEPPDA